MVNADWELPIYQTIGPVVRVHWDYVQREINDEFDGPRTTWDCQEAIVPIDADRETFVQIVNTAGGDGETLADGWFTE